MNKEEIMSVVKEYLSFKINYKDYWKPFYHYTPQNFYRPLRQWANIHKVSILAEVAQQAFLVMRGKFVDVHELEDRLTKM